MNIVAIIPARGGSKGLPGKNIKPLIGKPLIAHAIDCALNSAFAIDVVVSTDSDEIATVAKQYNAQVVMRPPAMAQDTSLVIDAIRYTLKYLQEVQHKKYDAFLLLEPTAPLRLTSDIDDVIKILSDDAVDSVATFTETHTPPTRLWAIDKNNVVPFIEGSNPFLPRQSHKKGYFLNGIIYGLKIKTLEQHPESISILLGNMRAHIIPSERAVDIDNEIDFVIAEEILKRTHERK